LGIGPPSAHTPGDAMLVRKTAEKSNAQSTLAKARENLAAKRNVREYRSIISTPKRLFWSLISRTVRSVSVQMIASRILVSLMTFLVFR
jgi:hypothetical protein